MMNGTAKKTALVALVSLALVALAPGSGWAKMLTVWPDKFTTSYDSEDPLKPTLISAGGLQAEGSHYAAISLPVGATVKKLWVTYTGLEAADPTELYGFCIYLRRTTPTTAEENLITFHLYPEDSQIGTFTVGNLPAEVVLNQLKIKSGHRYFLVFEPSYPGIMRSVQVEYTVP